MFAILLAIAPLLSAPNPVNASPNCANGHLCFSMCADGQNICGICMGAYCIAVCHSDGESWCLDTNQGGQANTLIKQIYPALPTATPTSTP